MLALMNVESSGREEGRDCSRILTTGRPPEGWRDVTFLRSTGRPDVNRVGWIAAVTPRYKLILSSSESPWLLDLEEDPDELTNFIQGLRHREVAKSLALELINYGRKFQDPYCSHPTVKAQLAALAG